KVHFSEVFSLAELGKNSSNKALAAVALDEIEAPIIRASALTRMQYLADSYSINTVNKLSTHSNQYIRQGILDAIIPMSVKQQKQILNSLLSD
ncbi:hypothetical protein AB4342_19955, partial [Vibrio breoganii]